MSITDDVSIIGEDGNPLPSVVVSNIGFSVAFVSWLVASTTKLVLRKLGSFVVTYVSMCLEDVGVTPVSDSVYK